MQALEAVKLITGIGETVSNRVIAFDALTTEFSDLKITRSPHCSLCGKNPTILELEEYQIQCKLKGAK